MAKVNKSLANVNKTAVREAIEKGLKNKATWTVYKNKRCYTGRGAQELPTTEKRFFGVMCEQKCGLDPQCAGVTWNRKTKICQWLTAIDIPMCESSWNHMTFVKDM